MFARDCFKVAGLICLVLPFTGCTNNQVGSITVTPATESLTIGQSVQYTATGTVGHGSHPATSTNLTAEVSWSSSTPGVATISSSGAATAVAAGSTIISATMAGVTTATATLTVTAATSGGGTGTGGSTSTSLASLAVIPGTQSVAVPPDTTQFFAIGTTTSGATENLTTPQVTWYSSSAQVATILPSGVATAVGQGTTTITAIATNGTNSVVTGSATLTVTSGSSEQITALSIIPSSLSVSASNGDSQLIALGTQGSTGLDEDVTGVNGIQWQSSAPTIASVGPTTGLVTGVSPGTATITAEYTNNAGSTSANVVAASTTVTVTLTAAPEPLLSLTIIPQTITVGDLLDTGNFLAIGTFSDVPYVRDLTNSVQWLSSEPDYFPVNSNGTGVPNPGATAGVVTAYSDGSAVIIAEATSSDGTIQTATATFSCPYLLPAPPQPGSCAEPAQLLLATVTVYNEGLNQSNWLVTAPSATGTPNVIHCGPGSSLAGLGGSVCVATYPIGSTPITFTATQVQGGTGSTTTFGGWSSSCQTINPAPSTPAGPNTCTILPTTTNETVGAIFN